jgi:hypothetical protein
MSFANPRRAVLWAIAAAAVLLSACGGGGSDSRPTTNDTVASTAVSPDATYPVAHKYAGAGTYTLTVTGRYTAAQVSGADALRVFFSFSGQGAVTGDSGPSYAVSSSGQVIAVSQTVTVTTTGSGPWQMAVLCFTGSSSGTMTDLNLESVTD